jgi:hypothetical protein
MRKFLFFTAVLFAAASTFGQGQLIFANSAATAITNINTGQPCPGSSAQDDTQVGLYVGNVGDPVGTLTMIGPPTNLFSAGRFSGGTRTLPGWTGTVQIQVRCWLASTVYPSYEAALAGAFGGDGSVLLGVSAPFSFTLTTVPTQPVSIAGNGLTPIVFGCLPAYPYVENMVATVLGTNSADGTRIIRLSAQVTAYSSYFRTKFQYGPTSAYGGTNSFDISGTSSVTMTQSFAPGLTYHWNLVVQTPCTSATSPDRTFAVAPLGSGVPGDVDGDGLVNQSELDAVYARYLGNGPPLSMTGVAGLGSTNVSFAIPGAELGSYTVEYSTNLTDWLPLGSVAPRYGFTDPNAPGFPVRQYRLRYP